jgi:hypothetical protein
MLPHAIALSDIEIDEIKHFSARGGMVLADTEPGIFDQHSRRRTASPLQGVALMPQVVRPDAEPSSAAGLTALAALLTKAGAVPLLMTGPDGQRANSVDAHVFRNGDVQIVTLQAMVPWGAPAKVGVQLPASAFIYDMRRPSTPRQADRLEIGLDPLEPTILALSPTPLPAATLSGPDRAQPGAQLTWRVGFDRPTPAATHAMRIDLLDPSGRLSRSLSGILRVGSDGAEWTVSLPPSAPAGQWTLQVSDSMAGRSVVHILAVVPP